MSTKQTVCISYHIYILINTSNIFYIFRLELIANILQITSTHTHSYVVLVIIVGKRCCCLFSLNWFITSKVYCICTLQSIGRKEIRASRYLYRFIGNDGNSNRLCVCLDLVKFLSFDICEHTFYWYRVYHNLRLNCLLFVKWLYIGFLVNGLART